MSLKPSHRPVASRSLLQQIEALKAKAPPKKLSIRDIDTNPAVLAVPSTGFELESTLPVEVPQGPERPIEPVDSPALVVPLPPTPLKPTITQDIPSLSGTTPGEPPLAEGSPHFTEEPQGVQVANSMASIEALNIQSPFDFLCFFDDEINSGRVVLYPWQLEILEEFVSKHFTKDSPYEGAKACCNGSGKDKYIIAPFAVWMLCTRPKSRVIITTASGNQLATQTEPYIRQLCQKVNSFLGREHIIIKQRHMTIPIYNEKSQKWEDGSEICLFATDEGYKAEGYHPWEDGCDLALIVNEAKGVLPEIFEALDRCTGYTYNLMVSSPGPCYGNFYNYYLSGIPRSHKVTAYMCKHIPEESINKTARLYGKESALFRSKILAEFTNIQGQTVIGEDDYQACLANKDFKIVDGEPFAGLDTSKGGDETSLSVWIGNREIAKENFQSRDITVQAEVLVTLFQKYRLKGHNINSDDGGISGGINDLLHRKGFFVNRVVNQSQAQDTSAFQNRGAELYFNFNRLIQEKLIMPMKDEVSRRQLVGRKYKKSEALGKICLQSKKEAKAEGQHSPDRADAMVLAFAGKNVYDYLTGKASSSIPSSRQNTSVIMNNYSTAKAKDSSSPHTRIIEAPSGDPYATYEALLQSKTNGSRSFGYISRLLNN